MALFVGRIPRNMSNRDLEDTFSKFGKITRLDVKKGFGFVEYEDKRDGEDALKSINGKGELVVEWAKNGGKRPGENECFFCGKEGHWARDCPDGGGRDRRRRDRSPRRGGGGDRRDRDFDRRRDRSPRRDYRSERDYDRRDRRGGSDRRREGRYDRDDRRDDRREDDRREERRNSGDQGDYGREDRRREDDGQE